MSHNEADTCGLYVEPRLKASGWEDEPHRVNSQRTFTDGRIVVAGQKARRRPGKRADHILRHTPDIAMALLEGPASWPAWHHPMVCIGAG